MSQRHLLTRKKTKSSKCQGCIEALCGRITIFVRLKRRSHTQTVLVRWFKGTYLDFNIRLRFAFSIALIAESAYPTELSDLASSSSATLSDSESEASGFRRNWTALFSAVLIYVFCFIWNFFVNRELKWMQRSRFLRGFSFNCFRRFFLPFRMCLYVLTKSFVAEFFTLPFYSSRTFIALMYRLSILALWVKFKQMLHDHFTRKINILGVSKRRWNGYIRWCHNVKHTIFYI